ncbi:MAG: hypothetical protein ABR861_05230 [Terriglobales bacterium]|jgi:hypothetical protein
MDPHTEYKVISANSTHDFQRELLKETAGGWKPILLTSAAVSAVYSIAAILEKHGEN